MDLLYFWLFYNTGAKPGVQFAGGQAVQRLQITVPRGAAESNWHFVDVVVQGAIALHGDYLDRQALHTNLVNAACTPIRNTWRVINDRDQPPWLLAQASGNQLRVKVVDALRLVRCPGRAEVRLGMRSDCLQQLMDNLQILCPDVLDELGRRGFLDEARLEIEATVAQDIELEPVSPVEPRYPAGDFPSGLVTADFNQDGCDDLTVANWGSDNVSILLGDCQGRFSLAVNLPAAAPSALVAADFNGDGTADLAFGDAAGVHVAWCGPDVEVSGGPRDLAALDFDSDGFPDLASLSGAGVFLTRNTSGPRVGPSFRRGDCNDDGSLNISDAVCTLLWLFRGQAAPGCLTATDTNSDGDTNLADAVYLLSFLFRRGPPPSDPFPDCGPGTSPADETLGCKRAPESCRE